MMRKTKNIINRYYGTMTRLQDIGRMRGLIETSVPLEFQDESRRGG
jgi:hypothetical protein